MVVRAEELDQRLKRQGFRMTRQRAIVLQELARSHRHLRADEVYQLVKKKIPHVSFGTIYRSLKLLQEIGFVRELEFGKCFSRYEAASSDHQHFICTQCCSITDVDNPVEPATMNVAVEGKALRADYYRLEFYGLCYDCQRGGTKIGKADQAAKHF